MERNRHADPRSPDKINSKRSILRHIKIKLLKVKGKENLESYSRKQIIYTRKPP